jgi:hypothetical protein
MKLLISEDELKNYKSRDHAPLECYECNKTFLKEVKIIRMCLKGINKTASCKFCSLVCTGLNQRKRHEVKCANCDKSFIKRDIEISKSKNDFCSQSCAGKYNSKHKTTGFTRSKAELLLEELIKTDFPDLPVQSNVRDVLDSGLEIDIFLPSLNIAIELNGPVHYFPIYGQSKLEDIQNKDLRKQVELQQKGFNLIVIDISQNKHWNKSKPMIENFYINYIKPLLQL